MTDLVPQESANQEWEAVETSRRLKAILDRMKRSPRNVRFSDLSRVCEAYFGAPRGTATSHRVFRTPWSGAPRVNIQNRKGMAKPYQVRQALEAIEKITTEKTKTKTKESAQE